MAGPLVYTLGRLLVDLYGVETGRPLESVETFKKYLGGSAGNTAVALSRLGTDSGLISRVGADPLGTYLLNVLRNEGVSTAMVHRDPEHPTGVVFAALSPPADSEVLFYPKDPAYRFLQVDDVDWLALERAEALVVAGAAFCQEPTRSAALAALTHRRQAGFGLNVVDVDWRPGFWTSWDEAHEVYEHAFAFTDIVLANEPELAFAGRSDEPETASQNLLQLGPREIVAKRGGAGAWSITKADTIRHPGFTVAVVNTLGAGDAFGAAYVHGHLNGWPAAQRLAFATAAGAIVVSRHSCSQAMPRVDEVQELLRTGRLPA